MDSNNFYNELARGQIWHINKGKTTTTGCEMWSNRPALIVGNDVDNKKADFVKVVYLTTQKRKHRLPTQIDVWSGNKKAIALCEQVHTVDKSRIGFYIGTVDAETMLDIDKALLFSFGIANTLKPSTLFKKWANAVDRYNIDLTEPYNEDSDDAVKTDIIATNEGDMNIKLKEMSCKLSAFKSLYKMEHDTRMIYEKGIEELKTYLNSLKNMHDLENALSVLDQISKFANLIPADETNGEMS